MDIHRCRYVPYPTSSINALAFSHISSAQTSHDKTPSTLRLAVGRANGDIEIWNPAGGDWFQESTLRGGKDRSIEGLAWTQNPGDVNHDGKKQPGRLRLFSIGYSATVTEWDLAQGKPVRHSSGNYSEIWCIVAQPRSDSGGRAQSEASHPDDQSLAIGCADGGLRLLTTADNDLQYGRTLARAAKRKARVLSIAFQNSWTIIAGHADSTIRIFDTRNGQSMRYMSLGAAPKGGPSEILVWALQCLPDGTIVSGDSTGTISFWDGKTYTLHQRIKSHEADILIMACSSDGTSVFSGGMDRKTILYRKSASAHGNKKSYWTRISHSRLHNHDIKAMTTFESNRLSVLVSGGKCLASPSGFL